MISYNHGHVYIGKRQLALTGVVKPEEDVSAGDYVIQPSAITIPQFNGEEFEE